MKNCIKCNLSKPLSEFHKLKRNKDGHDNKCKECKSLYDKTYYEKRYTNIDNAQKRRDLKHSINMRNRRFIYNYLVTHPCINCGESDPIVLEFDHLDGADKKFNISEAHERSLDSIKNEISKCRILCANCHRRRTAIQAGWYKNIL